MFNSICDVFSDRKKQLILQSQQDEKLDNIYNECPLTIFKLVMLERKINRDQLDSVQSNSIMSMMMNIKKNIDTIDNYQSNINTIINGDNICKNIDTFMKKF